MGGFCRCASQPRLAQPQRTKTHKPRARRALRLLTRQMQATFEQFTALLPESECRYAVLDYSYVGKEGIEKSKIFFISWVPDTAKVRTGLVLAPSRQRVAHALATKVKAKMLYASSKERFRRELDGIQLEVQATDQSEIEESVLRDKCASVGQ